MLLLQKYSKISSIYDQMYIEKRDSIEFVKLNKKYQKIKEYRKEYILNTILIFNSFIEYGFINNNRLQNI